MRTSTLRPMSKPITTVIPAFSTEVDEARRFTLGRQTVADGLPCVVSGGWELCAPHYRMERSGTPALAVEDLLAGEGTLMLAGTEVPLVPGTLFAYGPGVPHRIRGTGLSKYFVNLTGPEAEAALAAHDLTPGAIRRLAAPAALQPLFDVLITAGQAGGAAAPTICAHLTMALLGTTAAASTASGATDLTGYATYQRALAIMDERHAQVATVEAIAETCGVTTVYLCRLFGQYGQETPLQHLTRLRMNRAAVLLGEGRKARDVAAELGFADQFHFSRCFRRVYGVSPRGFLALTGASDRSTPPPRD